MLELENIFKKLRYRHRKALIPFVMAGDPDLGSLPVIGKAIQAGGADVLEVGIPFSDPLADGPTIQAASARALKRGVTPKKVLKALARMKAHVSIPIVTLTYWNPVLQYGNKGPESFLKDARKSGVIGVIVPDLPVEEGSAFRAAAAREGIAAVFLIAPTSGVSRIRAVVRQSQGFIYYVSVAGTTGARAKLSTTLLSGLRQVRRLTTKPVCVGFGISTPAQARAAVRAADGVIVGSALIERMRQAGSLRGAADAAQDFVSTLRRGLGS